MRRFFSILFCFPQQKLNKDDDNANGIADYLDNGAPWLEDDDLIELRLGLSLYLTNGIFKIEVLEGAEHIRIWEKTNWILDPLKEVRMHLTNVWDLAVGDPAEYASIEGISTSSIPRDVVLRLSYSNESFYAQDMVKFSVVNVELIPKSTNVCWTDAIQVEILTTNRFSPNGILWTRTNGLAVVSTNNEKLVFTPTNSIPTNYLIKAEVVGLATCYDTTTVTVYRVDLDPASTNVCWNSTNRIEIVVTNSYAPNGVVWSGTNGLAVISANSTNLVFTPTNSFVTNYSVRAAAVGFTNCFDNCLMTVLKVELEASKNLLTLKHDRDCNLEVKTTPATGIAVDEYRIDIKRTNSATWYALNTNKTMNPWQANIAGGFHLRGMAKIGGTECYSTNIVVVNQFPTYTQIEGDADVRTATDTEWANTLTDCTGAPMNLRRERGFWILLNTTSNAYQFPSTVTGPWVSPTQGASISLGATPADVPAVPLPNSAGAVYTVGRFHTHTPRTYCSTNSFRRVGPSTGTAPSDVAAANSSQRVGMAYDYVGDAAGRIRGGHPEGDPAQRYPYGPLSRPMP